MRFSLPKMLVPVALLGLLAFAAAPPHKTKLYLIGDSTMATKIRATFPETGWGMPLFK